MALNPQLLQTLMMAQLASSGIRGTKMTSFAGGISEGIIESFLMQNIVNTVDVGLLPAGAPGIGVGKMAGLDPKLMSSMMLPLVAAEGILGTKSKNLIDAICNAVCTHFLSTNIVNTLHPLVAVGSGTGKVAGLQPNLISTMILAKLTSKGVRGTKIRGLAKGIATGFANNLMSTATVSVAIAGAPLLILGVPVPSGGPGTGNIT